MHDYLNLLFGSRVALVVHPCAVVDGVYLVDTLISKGVNIVKIFAPEHGFRGQADAGELVNNEIDQKTGIKIVSLYGKNKKPSSRELEDVDLVLFDLQDVGVRFYTYLSTLHYIMEACAENKKKLIVLDRPNPNGHYVDGPILEDDCKSFIGMHPIPIVHGMTLGEMAQMIKSEQWIKYADSLELKIIPCANYSHESRYILPIKPSPNLPNELSILLYPSICLLEGTIVSLGRGTDAPFQIYGHPDFAHSDTVFTPISKSGAKSPPLLGQNCKAFSLRSLSITELRERKVIDLEFIQKSYKNLKGRNDFFLANNFIDLLVGNKNFKYQIKSGMSELEIRKSWSKNLEEFKVLRTKYLIYK